MMFVMIKIKGKVAYNEQSEDGDFTGFSQNYSKLKFDRDVRPITFSYVVGGEEVFSTESYDYLTVDDIHAIRYTYDSYGNKIITEEI